MCAFASFDASMVPACSDDGAAEVRSPSQAGRCVSPELASIDAMENGLAPTPEVGPSSSTDGEARKHAAAALTDGAGAVRMVEAGQARASPQSVTEGPPRRSTLKDTGSSLGSSLKSVHSDGVTPTPNP